MSTPVLIGFPQSSYVMTARAALALKGVEYELLRISGPESKTPAHLARHPWGKVPAFEHGEVRLFETDAICRYVDEAFEGPSLQPATAADRARMTQWISVVNCYFYRNAVPRYILKYIFASAEGPDRAAIDASVGGIAHDLDVLEEAVGEGAHLVGSQTTLADLFVAPVLMGLGRFPEGKQLLSERPGLGRLVGKLVQQPAFMSAFQGA